MAPSFLTRADGTKLAYRFLAGAGPTIIFLPGYMSDMQGGKASALWQWAAESGRAMLLLDYSGCGESGGKFSDGSLSAWCADAAAIIDARVDGPVTLVGSSMGGWIMLLLAEKMGSRVASMVGIAAAHDFTDWDFDATVKAEIMEQGVHFMPNPYGPEPTPVYRKFFEDGQAQLMLHREIAVQCPVRLLHGQCDKDVPHDISLRLAAALGSSDVQVTLVKDGDHRLSRAEDIDLLINIVARLPR